MVPFGVHFGPTTVSSVEMNSVWFVVKPGWGLHVERKRLGEYPVHVLNSKKMASRMDSGEGGFRHAGLHHSGNSI